MSDPQQLQTTGDGAPLDRQESAIRQFSDKEVALIKRTICQGATDEELSMFIQNCKRYGLDPFTGQIHAVKRWDSSAGREVLNVQVGIDGFRLIADRTGKWGGTLGPYWCGQDGEWRDVWLSEQYPAAAKVGVLRTDFSEPRWGIARWEAYVATKKGGAPNYMWQKMPAHMLAKCAEALALRSAFPNDLSGLYTDAEMDQAGGGEKRTYAGPEPEAVEAEEVTVSHESGQIQECKADQWYRQATEYMTSAVREGDAEASDFLRSAGQWPTDHPIDDWPEVYAEALTERLKEVDAEASAEAEDPTYDGASETTYVETAESDDEGDAFAEGTEDSALPF